MLALALLLSLSGCLPGGPNATDAVVVQPEVLGVKGRLGDLGATGNRGMAAVSWGDHTVLLAQHHDGRAVAMSVDPRGTIGWEREVACPTDVDRSEVLVTDEAFVCATDTEVVALSLETGETAWRLSVPARDAVHLATTGDRVLVGLVDQELWVVDAHTGEVLRRFATEGAWLRGAAPTEAGGLAFLVRYSSSLGPGLLLAQPLVVPPAGPPVEGEEPTPPSSGGGLEPLASAWEVPWNNTSGDLSVAGSTVLGLETPDLLVNRDQVTGRLNWQTPRYAVPWLQPEASTYSVAGTRDDGTRYVGAVEPATGDFLWTATWDAGVGLPLGRDGSGDNAVFFTPSTFRAHRHLDGHEVSSGVYSGDHLAFAAMTDLAVVTVVDATWSGAVEVHLDPLRPRAEAPDTPAPRARPSWLAPGTKLTWTRWDHPEKDPTTGRYAALDGTLLEVEVLEVGDSVRFAWASGEEAGDVTLSAEVLETAHHHHDDFTDAAEGAAPEQSTLWVSREVYAELIGDGHTSFTDAGSSGTSRLEHTGHSAVQVQWVGADGTVAVRDIPVVTARARNTDDRYWLGEFEDAPLLVQAERPDHFLTLTRIELAAGTTP